MGEVRGFPAGLWAKVGWGDRSWCCKLKEPGIGVPGLELLIQERIIVLQCLVTVVIRKWTVGRKDRGVVVSVSADPLLPSVGMDCHLESDMSPTGLCFTYLFYSWMLWNPQEEGPDGGSRSLGVSLRDYSGSWFLSTSLCFQVCCDVNRTCHTFLPSRSQLCQAFPMPRQTKPLVRWAKINPPFPKLFLSHAVPLWWRSHKRGDGIVDILEDAWTKGYRRMMWIVQVEGGREDCGAGWVGGRPLHSSWSPAQAFKADSIHNRLENYSHHSY